MNDRDNVVVTGYHQGRRGHIIKRKPGDEIPKGAIQVDPTVVAKMKSDLLRKRPPSQMWALHGGYIVCGSIYASTAIFTYNLRRKLKLFSNGRVICYVVGIGGPVIIAGLLHDELITKRILESRSTHCPICLPTKAACVNLVAGWLMPTTLSFMATSYMARASYTYKLPPANDFLPLVKALNKVSYRLRPLLGMNMLIAAVLPFVVTHYEQKLIDGVEISPEELSRYMDRVDSQQDSNGS